MAESGFSALFIPTRNEARGVFKHLRIDSKMSLGRLQIYEARKMKSEEKILLVLTGMGPLLSEQAAEYVFKNYSLKEAWLLGVCGASQIGYDAGDAFIAQEVALEDNSKPKLAGSATLIAEALRHFETLSHRHQACKIITVQKVIDHPSDKIELGQKHDCLGLEMEAYPLAEAAFKKGVPFLQIRWVLDPAEYAIPPLDFVDASGNPKPFATFKAFATQPSLSFKMIPFARKVQIALKNMNEFLHSYLEGGNIRPT